MLIRLSDSELGPIHQARCLTFLVTFILLAMA